MESSDPEENILSNKKSLVHEYFTHDKKNDVSKCNTCTASIKGSNTTNLENHLKIKKHKHKEYVQYLKDKENAALSCNTKRIAKAKAKTLLQPTLPQIAIQKAKYTRKNTKQLLLRKKLAFCIATTSMTNQLCDNEDWQAYVLLLDPRHKIPGRKAVAADVIRLYKQSRKLIKARIHQAVSKANITADIWTKPGMASSYLGATIHYVNADHEFEHAVLELLHFPSPHTGTLIGELMKKVLTEWDIEVPIIVTDNGGNMIKAFQLAASLEHIDKIINDVALGQEENNTTQEMNAEPDEDSQESLFSESDQSDDSNASFAQSHYHSFADDNLENAQVIPSPNFLPLMPENESPTGTSDYVDEGDPWEIDPGAILLEESEIDQDILQFVEQEKEIEEVMRELMTLHKKTKRMRRIRCLSHSLQLVMAAFDKYRVKHLNKPGTTIPFFIKVIARAKRLVAKFKCSTKATPRLIELCNKKLIGDVSTRWSSTFLLLQRLLELRDAVTIVCGELEMDGLSNSEWTGLKKIVNLLEPFASYTQLCSADKTVTFSAIVPCIEELRLHLEKFSEENPSFAGVCAVMKNDLNARFDFMIDETMDNFDSIYLLATELDPNYRMFVSREPAVQNIVTRHINKTTIELGLDDGYENEVNPAENNVQEDGGNGKEGGTGTDHPRNLDAHQFQLLYAKTVSAAPESSGYRQTGSRRSKIQSELLDYVSMDLDAFTCGEGGVPKKIDSLLFWKTQGHRFPYLSKLAFTLLALQASSAPSEREFSIAGWHCAGRKNRTDKENLSAKVFITCNKDLLRPLLF